MDLVRVCLEAGMSGRVETTESEGGVGAFLHQRARLNIRCASFLKAAPVFVLPNPRGTTLFAICAKVSFG
jgi:hypothetical protein